MSATTKSDAAPQIAAPAASDVAAAAGLRTRRTRKTGIVVSAKMEKTVTVEVTRTIKNERYGRFMKRSAKFLADDRVLGCKPGDVVEIEETRPLSARKRWRVISIITKTQRVG
ncbi:MAG: 30S ribosomal protein S17 [Thermoanaerobaculia bacterium]